MCGFAAMLRFDGAPVDGELLHRMRDAMFHRGPDDAGTWIDGRVGLAHRRLSVVDLSSAGRQPMSNEDGTIWLVFNGEIYNYVELAADLRRRGHTFASQTDSEVIIHLYEEVGERCVAALNGMFAFVIWDARAGRLFAARDRFGIKPFCYSVDPRRFTCASEIKALLEDPDVPRTPDPTALADCFLATTALGDRTPLAAVRQLPPAHLLTVQDGRVEVRRYWDVRYEYDERRPLATVVSELSDLLEDAVRIHCRSDAALGCHLSGGLDSGTVTSLAAHHRSGLPTFSLRFGEGGYYDETPWARAVAESVGTEHHEAAPAASDFVRLLPALAWHMDIPMPDAGGFAYYMVSRLAANRVTVTLTGHGGDELFAGYPAQFQTAFGHTKMFAPNGAPPRPGEVARRFPFGGVLRMPRSLLSRFRTRAESREDLWMRLHCAPPIHRNSLLHPNFVRSLDGYDPRESYLAPFRNAPTDRVLDRCLYHDLFSYLPGLLHMEDRVSMAVSLESRVPLLDYRIVEFLATVPPEQKVADMMPKALLRSAARRWLPASITERMDKAPFPIPAGRWMGGEALSLVRRLLLTPPCLDRGVLDPDRLRREPVDRRLWNALSMELWFRIFVDRDPEWLEGIGAARLEPRIHGVS